MASSTGPRYGDGAIGPGPYNQYTTQGMVAPNDFVDKDGSLMPNTFRFLNNMYNALLQVGGGPMQTVGSLPTDLMNHIGIRAFVSDATAPSFGSPVAGGGTVAVPVYCDGTAWRVG